MKSENFSRRNTILLIILTFSVFLSPQALAEEMSGAVESCMYVSDNGVITTVLGKEAVPEELRSSAKCYAQKKQKPKARNVPSQAPQTINGIPLVNSPGISVNEYGAVLERLDPNRVRPDEVKLDGNLRQEVLSTSLGRLVLRWPRSVEDHFGRNPRNAVIDAWRGAARALAQTGFPPRLRNWQYDWNVVVMERVPRNVDISSGVCHPAWMKPPADIFVAGYRLANSCGQQKLSRERATQELTRVLIHELGHAVEFQLLGKAFGTNSRWHAEGFARWFETLAGRYVVGRHKLLSDQKVKADAKYAFRPYWRPNDFRGSAEDYLRAYAWIAVIAERKSVSRLVDIYRRMEQDRIRLVQAVRQELGWDEAKWSDEVARFLGASRK